MFEPGDQRVFGAGWRMKTLSDVVDAVGNFHPQTTPPLGARESVALSTFWRAALMVPGVVSAIVGVERETGGEATIRVLVQVGDAVSVEAIDLVIRAVDYQLVDLCPLWLQCRIELWGPAPLPPPEPSHRPAGAEHWATLGIAPTFDLKAIKRAYTAAVRKHPPEGDGEAFQRVRAAYEAALAHAEHCQAAPDAGAAWGTASPGAVLADMKEMIRRQMRDELDVLAPPVVPVSLDDFEKLARQAFDSGLVRCRACGSAKLKTAEYCPQCGAPRPIPWPFADDPIDPKATIDPAAAERLAEAIKDRINESLKCKRCRGWLDLSAKRCPRCDDDPARRVDLNPNAPIDLGQLDISYCDVCRTAFLKGSVCPKCKPPIRY